MELWLRILPYDTYGVTLWSVEDNSGFTYFHCDTREDAEGKIFTPKENFKRYIHIR